MPGPFLVVPILFAQAQAAAPAAPAAKGGESGFSFITMLPAIFLLFYLIVLRPGQQEDRKRKDLVKSLKKNDRVLTAAGIYGTVVSINEDTDRVLLRVDDERNVRLEFSRASIARVIVPPGEKDKEDASKAAEGAKAR